MHAGKRRGKQTKFSYSASPSHLSAALVVLWECLLSSQYSDSPVLSHHFSRWPLLGRLQLCAYSPARAEAVQRMHQSAVAECGSLRMARQLPLVAMLPLSALLCTHPCCPGLLISVGLERDTSLTQNLCLRLVLWLNLAAAPRKHSKSALGLRTSHVDNAAYVCTCTVA